MPHAITVQDFQARSHASAGLSIGYRLFVPKKIQGGRTYPLMLTLHGSGERGDDNASQLRYGFSTLWAEESMQSRHPCFVLAPQCPAVGQWVDAPWNKGSFAMDKTPISGALQAVLEILDALAKEFPIDPVRVYVSGISMGGYATWYLLMQDPSRFAAGIPVCGAGDPSRAAALAQSSIWAFHAVDDPVVPVSGSRDMVVALQTQGGRIRYTEYPDSAKVGHASWLPAAQTPGLAEWVFAQCLPDVSDSSSGGVRRL